jgi:hypothetical protein
MIGGHSSRTWLALGITLEEMESGQVTPPAVKDEYVAALVTGSRNDFEAWVTSAGPVPIGPWTLDGKLDHILKATPFVRMAGRAVMCRLGSL